MIAGVNRARLRYSVTVYTRKFFIISLLIPLVFLIFGALVTIMIAPKTPGHLGAILVPYTSFFFFFLLWSSRHSPRDIRYAAYRAPLVFLAFQISYLVLEFSLGVSMAKDIIKLFGFMSSFDFCFVPERFNILLYHYILHSHF